MRLHVDLSSHLVGPPTSPVIVQAEREPPVGAGGKTPINGRYVIPMPVGLDIPVGPSSYVLDNVGDTDGGDVVSQGFARLLASFPQFGHIYFNPLLTKGHVAELSFSQTFKNPTTGNVFKPRFQTGRSNNPDSGQMPCHTALLPVNSAVSPNRPGLLTSGIIDIGPFTLDCSNPPVAVGADQFMLYWKLYAFEVSEDIATDTGKFAGQNLPALRYVQETEQEPDGFAAYLSTDGGANWCKVGLLEPVAFCDKTKHILIAFENTAPNKVYLANFAVLF